MIRLTSKEGQLAETRADAIVSEIRIGRSVECQWRVPSQYQRIGRSHARIVRQGASLFIEDLGSQNGTALGERRITREELVPGRTFVLGQALTLMVEADEFEAEDGATHAVATQAVLTRAVPAQGMPAQAVPVQSVVAQARPAQAVPVKAVVGRTPRLVGWTAAVRGKSVGIDSSPFSIGSATTATLPVPDALVSVRHAEIVRGADGGYAIQDLGSANGTFVNERRLDKEVLQPLKQGDRVFVAHHGFFFDDGRGITHERQAWLVGGSVALSIVLLAVGYRVSARPTPERLVAKADKLAAQERFEDATRLLGGVAEARLDEGQAATLAGAKARLDLWSSTFKDWTVMTNALAAGNWRMASTAARTLNTGKLAAWNWREGAELRQREASRIAGVFTNWVTASEQVSTEGPADPALLAALEAALANAATGPACPYADTLLRKAEECCVRLRQKSEIGRRFDCLNRLAAWPPPVEAVIAEVDRICREEPGPWVSYGEKLHEALKSASAVLSACNSGLRSVKEMAPDEALLALESTLVSSIPPAVVGVDPRVKKLFADLGARQERLCTLTRLIRDIKGLEGAGSGGCVKAWDNAEGLEKVLACDTVALGLRDPDRTQPVGEYDRYVGAESFYGFCLGMKGEKTLRPLVTPFPTEMEKILSFYKQVGKLAALVDKSGPVGDAVQTGLLADFGQKCRLQVGGRGALVKRFSEAASSRDDRRALIAAGIALQLAEKPDSLTVEIEGKTVSLKELALSRFEAVRQTLPSR